MRARRGGFGAVGGAEFTDGLREVVPDGSLRELQAAGDVGGGGSFGGEAEDLALAIGSEDRGSVQALAGEFRVNRAASGVDSADGARKRRGRRILQKVAAHAGVEGTPQVAGSGEGGDEDHAHGNLAGA